MKRNFTRNKEGVDFGNLGPAESTFIQVIDEIMTEIQWGGNFEFIDDTIKVTTKCFGCIDTTIFSGDEKEIMFLKELIANKNQVVSFLTKKMGITLGTNKFMREDLLAALELYLEGNSSSKDIEELLKGNKVPLKAINVSVADIYSDIKNNQLFKILDSDDGARHVANSFVLNQLSK